MTASETHRQAWGLTGSLAGMPSATTPPAPRPKPRAKPAKPAAEAPAAAPEGKTTRITLDLDPERYAALNKWLLSASIAVNPDTAKRISVVAAFRAMLDVTVADSLMTTMVLDQLRRYDGH